MMNVVQQFMESENTLGRIDMRQEVDIISVMAIFWYRFAQKWSYRV